MNLKAVPFEPRAVLDIGANVGGFYFPAKQQWPNAMFTLIEGNPACEEMLKSLKEPYYIALLGAKKGTAKMWRRLDAPTCTGSSVKRELTEFYADGKVEQIDLPVVTLDEVNAGRRVYDLIKIDTQGSELEIVKGGMDTIVQAKGLILELSYEEYNEGAPLAPAVINHMADIGFYPAAALNHICHPIKRNHIQDDMLFLNERIDR